MNYRIFLLCIGILAAGCSAAQPAAPATPTAVSRLPSATPDFTSTSPPLPTQAITRTPAALPSRRDVIFEESQGFGGALYGEGETAILLANMSIGGQKQWDPFVAAVDQQKFTTVTFDYRDIDDVAPDMNLILAWLKEEGFTRVICMGASLGTRACSSIAREPEIAGLVLIAGSVHHASVAEAMYPKLFISGALDRWTFDIERGYEQAAEPRELVLFQDNRAHGTDLFSSKDAEAFLTLLVDFVNGLATP